MEGESRRQQNSIMIWQKPAHLRLVFLTEGLAGQHPELQPHFGQLETVEFYIDFTEIIFWILHGLDIICS